MNQTFKDLFALIEDNTDLFKDRKFEDKEIVHLAEECSELITECLHLRRNKTSYEEVHKEMADVLFLIFLYIENLANVDGILFLTNVKEKLDKYRNKKEKNAQALDK